MYMLFNVLIQYRTVVCFWNSHCPVWHSGLKTLMVYKCKIDHNHPVHTETLDWVVQPPPPPQSTIKLVLEPSSVTQLVLQKIVVCIILSGMVHIKDPLLFSHHLIDPLHMSDAT